MRRRPSDRGHPHRRPWPDRSWSTALRIATAAALTALSAVLLTQSPAAAAPGITLAKSASADVLVGGTISYSLTASNPASNPDAVPEYNLTFRDVLPVGVTYDPGSSTPAGFGEPQVITDADTGQQTLIWSNVADLAPGSTAGLSFTATADPAAHPVGDTVVNNGSAYTNSDPRTVPKFTATGEPIGSSFTATASDNATTQITALEVRKSEPSPESELLRGVHDHTTVYTLTVTNAHAAATNNAVVTDLIPAGMEFLGCGGVDNSTTGPEYPGAPSLAATPPVSSCPTPASVSTVTNPAGLPAGVYTQVVWNLGSLTPAQVVTIRYAAGIPQRSNTTTWPGGTAPSPNGLGQTANLDNNNGPSTRETATELGLTNFAQVAGDYTGSVLPGTPTHVTGTDTKTVTAEDVAMRKTASTGAFVQGGVVRYTLTIDTSEYVDASGIVVTDHLPNGLCPLDNVANHVTGSPPDCAPDAAFAPSGATISNVSQNADGSFDVTFSPISIDHNGTAQISYSARMRSTYTGGVRAGEPTSAHDSFTNTASLDATTNPAPGIDPPAPTGPLTVHDDSSVTIRGGGPALTKSILPNATPMTCGTTGNGYVPNPTPAQDTFTEGSRICFKLHIDFPADVSTRNPKLTDFLPPNVAYEPGSATATTSNTAPFTVDESTGNPVFTIGDIHGQSRFAAGGAVFDVVLSGIVQAPGAGPGPDLTDNLAKFTFTTNSGTESQRASVPVRIAAPPPISVLKGVARVNGGPANPPNTDNVQVRGGDVVSYRIDLHNDGTTANENAVDILSPDVWDVLPTGIDCDQISAISDGGVCTDPGDPGQPPFTGSDTHSAIRWQLAATPALAPAATRTLTYDMTIPTDVGVSTSFPNTAAVASYDTATNRPGVTAQHLPANNIDTTTDPADWDAPAASDKSEVHTPGVGLTKSNVTDITESGNGPNQAVVGETLTYTIDARVPAHTSVFNGVLTDPMPTGITYLSSSATYSPTNTSPPTDPLPPGFTLNPANGTLTFPASYTNNDDVPHLFEVKIRARVSTAASNNQGVTRTNTATFSSTAAAQGAGLPPVTAHSTVTIVAPQITLTKTDDVNGNVVVGGQVVTYTLHVVGATGRPPAHDLVVIDCVPNGLAFGSFVPGHPGTATASPGDGTNGCATGTTRLAWNVPNSSTTSQALSYTATVSPDAAGNQTFTNVATATGSSLNDGQNNPNVERVVTSSASDKLTVASGIINKTADPEQLTIGQRGTWTVRVEISPNVNFYDSAILDQLPAAIDPNSVRLESANCTNSTGASCTLTGNLLDSAPGPNGSTIIGVGLGDIGPDPGTRIATITYSAVLRDLPSTHRGDSVTNIANGVWNLTNKQNPTSVTYSWDQRSGDAPATITVVEPVLSIAKSVTPTHPAPGDTFTYGLDISNLAGPNTSAAYNVTVVDQVPTGVVVDPSSISAGGVLSGGGPDGGGTITWTLPGPIHPGDVATLVYSATLANSATLTSAGLTNTAQITHYESLPSGGRVYIGPSASATVTPVFPHVSVTKQASPGPAYIGEPKAFTVTVTSDGQATAHDIGGSDTLPANWTYDPGSMEVSVAGGPTEQVEPDITTSNGVQTLTLSGLTDLPVGEKVVITYTATPQPAVVDNPGVGSSVPHTNTVAVHAADATGATGNADGPYNGPPATATVHIDSADVSVTKSHTGDAVPGTTLDYAVVVTNHGPDTAVGPFTVVDDLPAGIGSANATGTGWTCSNGLTQITCTRTNPADTLATGASFPTITVSVAIPPDTPDGATFTNHVSVSGRTFDPDLTNNADTDTATARRSVDLALDKQASGPFVAGQDATYTLTVANNGPSDSAGPIVVTDPVPAGTTFVSADGPGWACDETGGLVTCTRAAGLAAGDVAPEITLRVHVDPDRTDPVTNTGHVEGPSPDPVPGNNTDSVTQTPGQQADLAISKTSVDDFVPGSNGTYRFVVHNFGPSYADAPVRITDTLPAELTYVSFSSVTPGWTCSASGQDVTCEHAGRFPAGDSATVDITVAINPNHTGDIVNTAHVGSPTPDPDLTNNTDSDTTGSNVRVDLAIVKTHQEPVVAGQQVTYTLAVRNNGPSSAAGPVTVTDRLPTGMTFVSATGTGWTCTEAGREATCTHAAGIAAGADAPDITLLADVAPDAGPATLINIADVTGPDTDTDLDNNTAHDPTVVNDEANISLTKTTTGDNPVDAGGTTAFTIAVHNDGPSDADNVRVNDDLPAGMTLVSVDAGAGWTCDDTPPVHCRRDTLAANSDAPPIVVTVRVGSGVPDGTTITNTAESSTSTPGDDPADNTDSATVEVRARADLSIHKTHPPGEVAAGFQLTFKLAVTNHGPSDAQPPITVTDTLPVGMTYVVSNGPWTCTADPPDASGQQVTCTLDGNEPLIAGADAPDLHLTVQIDAAFGPGELTNTATVTSPTTDPDPDNNTDTDVVAVNTQTNLSIVKTHTGSAHIGDDFDFTLAVSNDGPSEARDVRVTDKLPTGLDFVSATGTNWTCSEAQRTVTCDHSGPIAPHTDADPITLTVHVTPAAFPAVENTAVVSSSTLETDPSDNSSTDRVPVPPLVDLSITKTHHDPIKVGHQTTYHLRVINHGPTDDPGPIRVADPLPDGLSYVSATGDGWTCHLAARTVHCTRAAGLKVGEHSVIDLVVNVQPSAYPSVVNTASVTSDAEDTDPSNNLATDPATVLPAVRLTVDKTLLSLTPETARYRITVGNQGPNDTNGDIVLVDNLPPELTYVSASGDGWTCTAIQQTVTCTQPQVLHVGDQTSFELTAAVAPGTTGQVVNTVVVIAGNTVGPHPTDSAEGNLPGPSHTGRPPGLPNTGGPLAGLPGGATGDWLEVAIACMIAGGLLIAWARRRTH